MASLPRVIVKPRRARPFFARHPWLFVTSIAKVEGEPTPGGEVEVYSHEGQFIARGIFNPNSAIRVRLYRWDGGPSTTSSGPRRSRPPSHSDATFWAWGARTRAIDSSPARPTASPA